MYQTARNSTIRLIADEIEALQVGQFYDWDAHAETFVLPDTDLIGIVGFACTQSDTFHDVVCGIGIMTQSDRDLGRLTFLVDHFYNRLKAMARFNIYDTSGTKIGVATCFDGTTVSPATQVDVRPAQTLSFSARLVLDGV